MGIAEQLLRKGILSVATGKYNANSMIPEALRFGNLQTKVGFKHKYPFIISNSAGRTEEIVLKGTPIISLVNGLIISTLEAGDVDVSYLVKKGIIHELENKMLANTSFRNYMGRYRRLNENHYYIHTKGVKMESFEARVVFNKELLTSVENAVKDFELQYDPETVLTHAFGDDFGDFEEMAVNKNIRIMTTACGGCYFIDDTEFGTALRDELGENNIVGVVEGCCLFFSPPKNKIIYPALIIALPIEEMLGTRTDHYRFWEKLDDNMKTMVPFYNGMESEIPQFSDFGKIIFKSEVSLAPSSWHRVVIPFENLDDCYRFTNNIYRDRYRVSTNTLIELEVQPLELPEHKTLVNQNRGEIYNWTIRYAQVDTLNVAATPIRNTQMDMGDEPQTERREHTFNRELLRGVWGNYYPPVNADDNVRVEPPPRNNTWGEGAFLTDWRVNFGETH